jgi:hypothetical protein
MNRAEPGDLQDVIIERSVSVPWGVVAIGGCAGNTLDAVRSDRRNL